MAVLILIDLWTVDRRYLNDSNFVKQQPAEMYKETVADKAILQDTGSTFRVLNINNPWQETNTSYFHHSIGGYHAVKQRRYQELIDHRLDGEYRCFAEGTDGRRRDVCVGSLSFLEYVEYPLCHL